jgi:hypothetical protein
MQLTMKSQREKKRKGKEMNSSEITIKFIEYDGTPSTRPPLFEPDPPVEVIQVPAHKLDGCHRFLMVIPEGQAQPLGMAFMLFWPDAETGFELVAKFSGKKICDDCGEELPLDDEGFLCFPLQRGLRWALWPTLATH